MRARSAFYSVPLLFLSVLPLFAFARPRPEARSRRFEFTYIVTLKRIPAGAQVLRVWIPVASADAHQSVAIRQISAPAPAHLTRGRTFGDRMLYAEIHRPRSSTAQFKIVYEVTRREYSLGTVASLLRYDSDPAPLSPVLKRFLKPDRLVPTSGLIKQIADEQTRGKKGEVAKAYALYNYVFHTMRYDKSGTGWGRGDALWACDARHGNCTDFHSLFIALARSEGIPARFAIGFALPGSTHQAAIPGYHCWAEFYVNGAGWVPVDISEAWITPSLHEYFFGSLDANRVRFSMGRDLILTPRQSGPPVNYFVYPYVEVDGRPLTSVEKQFSFRDLRPASQ